MSASSITPTHLVPSWKTFANPRGALVVNLVVNGLLPYLAYQALTHRGVPPIRALALTAVFPLGGLAVEGFRSRRLSGFSIISLLLIAIGIAGTFVSGSPKFYLVRMSMGTALFGIACLGSLLARRPILFYLSRSVIAAESRERADYFDSLWAAPQFRRVMVVLSVTWGVGYLIEAGLRALAAWSLPISTFLIVEPILAYGFLVGLLAWTMRYSRAQARGT